MALPSSGPISFGAIRTEFRGSTNTGAVSMSDYYAGGPYVPAGTTGTNGAVPSSGPLIVPYNFYGTSVQYTIYPLDQTVMDPYTGETWYYAGYDDYEPGSIAPNILGSLVPDTATFYNGAKIHSLLWWSYTYFSTTYSFQLSIAGNQLNSGWKSFQIEGNPPVNRTAMTYTYNSTYDRTQWDVIINDPYPNPIPVGGISRSLVWDLG